MPYNAGMTQITLVLPYALPPAELAQDLVRALNTPALAALLSRAASRSLPFDDAQRALPHETWLAQTLGLSDAGAPAFAAAASASIQASKAGSSSTPRILKLPAAT